MLKDLIFPGRKRLKTVINQWLEGSQAVGKDEVSSSNLDSSSMKSLEITGFQGFCFFAGIGLDPQFDPL